MKIWIVLVNDRHIDPIVEAWSSPEHAIQRAKDIIVRNCHRRPDEIDTSWKPDEHLWHASFSCEGDHGYVFESSLNPAPINLDRATPSG